jgi:hypothetical protein
MDAAFGDDVVDISGPFFRFPLYFALLFRKIELETGSMATASATTQSFATEEFLSPREKPRIGGVVRGAISL